ncbi:glycosyltransferase [Williamsia serinedens]|uniref:Glycosyltransferase involved in cell wall bisynthesis n=1 Tax=Williamsia serinedens TaxID=391736 RepID=A0ABT1H3T8_9NOCA|nr:glycosyltransferase [Williamsia serinedens]MCP2161914.1 Glycosyltransferase involved in cell wall bisynthesis [Williamsia serinedens]
MIGSSISVLVPCLNAATFVAEAVASAQNQMGPDDELIIQDGGSTDGTVDILRAVCDKDNRLTLVQERDSGQSDALNKALARATKAWVLWLNADDVILPGAMDSVRRRISEDPRAEVICGAHRILRSDGEVVDEFPGRLLTTSEVLRRGCATFSGSVVMRTDLLRSVGGFRTDLQCTMDMALQLEVAARTPRQSVIDEPIGALRFHEASKTARLWRVFLSESMHLRRAYASGLGEQVNAATGAAILVASIPVFRIRLTPSYRRIRRLVAAR